ncbi:hypothetical protein HID58_064091 [Brassica napus]|uniref:KIB1-4 beta-propeller domain-containing protein n=1 Tax=Brassica napus TaxID=3708 RepID=A0ABQ7Z9F6_BRANA|nr:hypothetical protein HID58_064091 [Brassica napus]
MLEYIEYTMSQLLSRLSKLSSRNKTVLKHKNSRLLSTSPYLIVGVFAEDARARGGGFLGDILLFDPAKEELLTVRDKTVSEELICSKVMGASHGWGFFSDLRNHNSVRITDFFNPLASKSDSKIIPLPPLTSMIYGQTEVVWNVAMSSSSPYRQDNEEGDCVVAIKFLGNQLSMCRPGRDLAWTNKLIPFVGFENSNLMYSKRDQRFSLPAPGGNYLCSWDLHFENEPKFTELVFRNLPELPQSEWELMDSCFREDHWVESPSGQSFLVKWYSHVPPIRCKEPMVMDQDTNEGTKTMSYTEDIGDLCIFLSKSEPFCVVASSFPGLKPNSIYLMGRCFAVYDITTKTSRHFERPKGVLNIQCLSFSSVSPNSRPGRTMFLYTHKSSRLFSTSPYLTLGTRVKEVLPGGCKIADVLLFDPVEEELVTVPDKTIPKELMDQEMVGASHGWGFFCARHDRSVRITDLFNPLASKSNPTVITLPQLTALPSNQIEEVCNVAMTSSPHLEDCVVAIKFSGNQMSLCRPGRDLEWTNILTPPNCLENSNLMYSKRDKKFYLPAPGGKYLFSYHLHSKEEDIPEVQEVVYRGHPELDQSEWELLSSCTRTEYLVESSFSGVYHITKRFMVFREEETTEGSIMCYTEDIGDMCIFLANSEAFCVPASSCAGLKPNSIYHMGRGLGFYDLTTGNPHQYLAPDGAPSVLSQPYWLPPFST